jgi:hypothetical protein
MIRVAKAPIPIVEAALFQTPCSFVEPCVRDIGVAR